MGGLFYFISSNKLFHLIDISHRLGRNAETCRIKDYKTKWCVLPVFDPNISLESGIPPLTRKIMNHADLLLSFQILLVYKFIWIFYSILYDSYL